jgi:hypothetical protein
MTHNAPPEGVIAPGLLEPLTKPDVKISPDTTFSTSSTDSGVQ